MLDDVVDGREGHGPHRVLPVRGRVNVEVLTAAVSEREGVKHNNFGRLKLRWLFRCVQYV